MPAADAPITTPAIATAKDFRLHPHLLTVTVARPSDVRVQPHAHRQVGVFQIGFQFQPPPSRRSQARGNLRRQHQLPLRIHFNHPALPRHFGVPLTQWQPGASNSSIASVSLSYADSSSIMLIFYVKYAQSPSLKRT